MAGNVVDGLDRGIIDAFLREIGVSPASDATRYDSLQRHANDWYKAGHAMSGFVEAYRWESRQAMTDSGTRAVPEELSWQRAMTELRSRYAGP